MRTIRAILIICLFLFSFTALCTGMDIKKAVIYNDMAFISFVRVIHGQTVIEAPSEMVTDSLSLVPLKKGVLRAVSIESTGTDSLKTKELKDALSKKKISLSLNRKAQAMVEKQVEIIYDSTGSKGKATSFDKSRLTEALEYINSRVTSLNHRLVVLSENAEKLEIEIKDLQNQISSISRKPGYKINIIGDGVVEISYAMRCASWVPQYRIFAFPDRKKLAIELAAQVRQSSNIDWDIRELIVSTGKPSFDIQAPELQPWYLDKASKSKGVVLKASTETTDKELVQSAREETEPQIEAATSYLIGTAKNIHLSGNGTPGTIPLRKQVLDAEFTRITTPKCSPQVFLKAESILKGDIPFVSGPYCSFVDGVFSGKGDIKRTEPGQKVKIDLGIDGSMNVERRELSVFHEKPPAGKDKTTYSYAIEIENTRNMPTNILVKDQAPVSRDDNTIVDFIAANPQAKPDEDGMIAWNIDMGPRKKERVELIFAITRKKLKP
jgi:uncharacterized protein (TIGR02231 family)